MSFSWLRWRSFWQEVEPYRRPEAASSRFARSGWIATGQCSGMRYSMPVVVERVGKCLSLKSKMIIVAKGRFASLAKMMTKRALTGCG